MSLKVYEYAKCSTCQKALKYLDKKKIAYEKIDITLHPPSFSEIKKMAKAVGLKRLFNTSGLVYKEMKLSAKLPEISEEECLKLLASNGRLIKRPFLLKGEQALVGFKEEEWKKVF